MAAYLGDFLEDETVHFLWDTNDSNGASITRAVDGTISVYKDNGVAQSVAGITDTEDFDALTGIHALTIDLSADAFYAIGANYSVVLSAATIDGQAVNAVLCHFSIENRFAEVDAVKISGDSTAADNAEKFFDGTGYPGTNNVIPTVSVLTGHTAQTGDSFGRIGVAGAGLTNIDLPNQTMDIVGSITGNLSGSVGSVTAGVTLGADAITSAKIADDAIAAEHIATGAIVAATFAANAIDAAATAADFLAEINAQVVDALATDTYSEPGQGAPGATISLAAKINYLFKAWRNQSKQNATTFELYNDAADTVDQKAVCSEAGGTVTKGEVETGP